MSDPRDCFRWAMNARASLAEDSSTRRLLSAAMARLAPALPLDRSAARLVRASDCPEAIAAWPGRTDPGPAAPVPRVDPIDALTRALLLAPDEILADLDAAFLTLIPTVARGAALAAALRSRRPAPLRAVLAAWPETNWAEEIARVRSGRIGTLMHERRLDLLEICLEAGIRMDRQAHELRQAAIDADDPAAARFLRDRIGFTGPLWGTRNLAGELDACGPHLAHFMAEELRRHADNPHSKAIRSFRGYRRGFAAASLKSFAALVAIGAPVARIFPDPGDLPPGPARILAMTGSNHGRLALRGMEPDAVDLIGRPAPAEFFGMSGAAYHEAMTAGSRQRAP